VEKYSSAGQASDYNIILRMFVACWITEVPDTLGICNTCCFSTATIVTRTRVDVKFIRTVPVLLGNIVLNVSIGFCGSCL
jgi:hypothetical protein